jgi:hypothetical protein
MEISNNFSTFDKILRGLEINLVAVDEFTQNNCIQELLPDVNRFRNKITKAMENVCKTTTAIHEMFNTVFLYMHSTENNTFRFLRFFKENNYFDFIHLDEKIEPSSDEMKLITSCNIKIENGDSMDQFYSICKEEIGDTWNKLSKPEIIKALSENETFAKKIESFLDDGVVIEFVLNNLCECIFNNNIPQAYEFIKFLHDHHLGIVPVSDIDIPSPTLDEIALFSHFSNTRFTLPDDYITTVEISITKYEETINPLNKSMRNLVTHAENFKETVPEDVEIIR